MTSAFALHIDPRSYKGLRKLGPDIRLEQICDMEAMERLSRETAFAPDRAKSDIISPPVHRGDTMYAGGAAFRSHGHWFRFSFSCTGTPDHLGIVAFSYKLGPKIPKSDWATYALW